MKKDVIAHFDNLDDALKCAEALDKHCEGCEDKNRRTD